MQVLEFVLIQLLYLYSFSNLYLCSCYNLYVYSFYDLYIYSCYNLYLYSYYNLYIYSCYISKWYSAWRYNFSSYWHYFVFQSSDTENLTFYYLSMKPFLVLSFYFHLLLHLITYSPSAGVNALFSFLKKIKTVKIFTSVTYRCKTEALIFFLIYCQPSVK